MPRIRRRNASGADKASGFIKHNESRDGAIQSLSFAFDAHKFASGRFGDEREALRELVAHFGADLPVWAWARSRLRELEGRG